jgi:hypothetical protein
MDILAVGLRSVGSGPPRRDPEIRTGLSEVPTPVGVAVVGEHALDRDAVGGKEGQRPMEEVDGGDRLLVVQLFGVRESAVVVDRDMNTIPAQAAPQVTRSAMDPVTTTVGDPAELLGVEMHEFARS